MNSTPPGFPPWITADGEIDLDKLPIDGILKQTIDLDNFERFRSGCAVLGSMAGGGRLEAGLYLIGLIGYYASDLQRLEVIVEQLAHFHCPSSANALLAEIRRVKSSCVRSFAAFGKGFGSDRTIRRDQAVAVRKRFG